MGKVFGSNLIQWILPKYGRFEYTFWVSNFNWCARRLAYLYLKLSWMAKYNILYSKSDLAWQCKIHKYSERSGHKHRMRKIRKKKHITIYTYFHNNLSSIFVKFEGPLSTIEGRSSVWKHDACFFFNFFTPKILNPSVRVRLGCVMYSSPEDLSNKLLN